MITKLDAVNYLLDILGSAPVDTIDNLHPDVVACLNKLEHSTRFVQQRGYWFNKNHNVTLEPDGDGEILLGTDTTKVSGQDYGYMVVQRGTKLYDLRTNSFVFTEPVRVDITQEWDFEEVPASVQNAIQYYAGYMVASIDLEDSQKASEQMQMYQVAAAEVLGEEIEIKRRNVFRTPKVQRTLQRVRPYNLRTNGYNPVYPGG